MTVSPPGDAPSGTVTCIDGTPLKCPATASATSTGSAIAATRSCMTITGASPAARRLKIIKAAMPNAASSGNKASAPNATTFGRRITSTPARAAAIDTRTARGARSPRNKAENSTVQTGLVKTMAVASASGIVITPMKKPNVATATAAPRPSCSQGRGMTKPARP